MYYTYELDRTLPKRLSQKFLSSYDSRFTCPFHGRNIRIDALSGDSMMTFPMLINAGYESFRVKETRAPEKDYPDWGDLTRRGSYWEIGTAMSLLAAGADLLILYHPQTVAAVKSKIEEMSKAKEG